MKTCVITGNPAGREKEGKKAAGQEERFHRLSDLPAEDTLVGNSQAEESGLGDPWEASAWEKEGGRGRGEGMVCVVPEFLSLCLLPSALVLVRAPQDCRGEREGGGGGPRESPEEPVH